MKTALVLLLLIGVIVIGTFALNTVSAECPSNTYGSGDVKIKYFSSPFCVACWSQKQVLRDFEAEFGSFATIEEFDASFCQKSSYPDIIQGVPAFIVNDKVMYGVQTKTALKEAAGI